MAYIKFESKYSLRLFWLANKVSSFGDEKLTGTSKSNLPSLCGPFQIIEKTTRFSGTTTHLPKFNMDVLLFGSPFLFRNVISPHPYLFFPIYERDGKIRNRKSSKVNRNSCSYHTIFVQIRFHTPRFFSFQLPRYG